MSINPDPKRYCIRFRKGKPVLFERETLEAIKRWRRAVAKRKQQEKAAKAPAPKDLANIFSDEI